MWRSRSKDQNERNTRVYSLNVRICKNTVLVRHFEKNDPRATHDQCDHPPIVAVIITTYRDKTRQFARFSSITKNQRGCHLAAFLL